MGGAGPIPYINNMSSERRSGDRSRPTRKFRPVTWLALAAAVMLALAPAIADARAGRGGSFGSRGTRTYQAPPVTRTAPTPAQPVQRSTTDAARPGAAPATAARPGLFGGGFGGLLMGGLLGAGLFGLLSGAGLFGGVGSFAGVLGLLLQIALIAWLASMALRFFRTRAQPAPAGAGAHARGPIPDVGGGRASLGLGGGGSGFGRPAAPETFAPDAADFAAFEASLKAIQAAWSAGAPDRLRSLVTPEMLGYFGEQHEELNRRGLTNHVEDVVLEQGDLAEAWRENGREYATVAMRFSARDWTEDAQGNVVEGSRTDPGTTTEVWTFVRPVGGRWELSAIQQAA